MKKISREGHFEFVGRWQEIVQRTETGEKFNDEYGFVDLRVWGISSYCEHYVPWYAHFYDCTCRLCPLFRESICANDSSYKSSIGTFVELMRQGKNKEALPYAKRVLVRLERMTSYFGYE